MRGFTFLGDYNEAAAGGESEEDVYGTGSEEQNTPVYQTVTPAQAQANPAILQALNTAAQGAITIATLQNLPSNAQVQIDPATGRIIGVRTGAGVVAPAVGSVATGLFAGSAGTAMLIGAAVLAFMFMQKR